MDSIKVRWSTPKNPELFKSAAHHAGMDGESKHTKKSRTSKSADHAGMDGESKPTKKSSTSKHTNKPRTSKSAAHAGVDVSVNNTPPIPGPLRQRRLSRDLDCLD
jgi:hypothetical protein